MSDGRKAILPGPRSVKTKFLSLTEAAFVRQFEYADLPGYVVVAVNGRRVTARIYSGITRRLWRTLELSELLAA